MKQRFVEQQEYHKYIPAKLGVLDLLRRYDTDWLRVLTMLTIFTFHCARFFDFGDWHVKNLQQSMVASVYTGFLSQWIMPVMFVISGMAVYYVLGVRTGKQFTQERFQRLLIPLIFGIFILIPPEVYYERVSHFQFSGSFFRFYPHYFDGFYAFGGNFAWMGLHLWYLLILFLFSIMFLPLFLHLKEPSRQLFIARLADKLGTPAGLILFAIPLAAVQLSFDSRSLLGQENFGGWNIFIYALLFIYGFILASHKGFSEIIRNQRNIFLIGAIFTAWVMYLFYWPLTIRPVIDTPIYMVLMIIRVLNSWLWILALLGFSSQYLSFNNRFLQYANEAVMPFYVLHQAVILTIGFFLVRSDLSIMTKYLLISSSSFITIMLIYELLIKRINLLRILFGMKPKNDNQKASSTPLPM